MAIIAAVGSDGFRPVVWGFGSTEEAAKEDARFFLDGGGARDVDKELAALVFCEVPEWVVYQIEYVGEVRCEELDIQISVGQDGTTITGAEYVPEDGLYSSDDEVVYVTGRRIFLIASPNMTKRFEELKEIPVKLRKLSKSSIYDDFLGSEVIPELDALVEQQRGS